MDGSCIRSIYNRRHWFSVCGRFLRQRRQLATFSPRRILILNKTTRYNYEKRARLDLSENELRHELMSRGSDYDGLQLRHVKHTSSLKIMKKFLLQSGMEVRVRERETYTPNEVEWCDAVLTAGGDGTFLYGASLVTNSSKPVVGINTDPTRSEGVLCVKSKEHLKQNDIPHILGQLLKGRFEWTCRHRIQIALDDKVIPYKALNEVYIGEKDPTHTAYYELSLDSGEKEKQKSSGLVVYTGSGSSAWVYNIHRLLPYQVKKVLRLAAHNSNMETSNFNQLVDRVTGQYNDCLVFDGSWEKMAFVVREAIEKGIFSSKLTCGTAKRLQVRSRCWDGAVILDAHKHFDFPEGAMVTLSMSSENAVKTVSTVD